MNEENVNLGNTPNTGVNQSPGIKKEHKFGLWGFVLGALIVGGITWFITNNNSQPASVNQATNTTQSTTEEQQPNSEKLVEVQQTQLEEGTIQDQVTQQAADEQKIVLPTYVGDQFGKEIKAGDNSIVITSVERGITFNAGEKDEELNKKWLRVYFTIKNLTPSNKFYEASDFSLETAEGEVETAYTDFLLGEFNSSTLVPNGTKKGFALFYTDTNSGTVVWKPSGVSSSQAAKISFSEK